MKQEIMMIDGVALIQMCEAKAKQAGVDFDRICKRAGLCESTVWRWAAGERWPHIATIQKLNKSFRDEVAELYQHDQACQLE